LQQWQQDALSLTLVQLLAAMKLHLMLVQLTLVMMLTLVTKATLAKVKVRAMKQPLRQCLSVLVLK
jgi:hypothetical protein